MGFCIFYVFSVMTFNITGLSITRYINALARAVCDVSRTVIIWLVGIIVTLTVGQRQANYLWEKTEVLAVLLQLVGYALIVLGNLVYNKIVQFPCILE
jgi:amino acid transporter